MPGLFPAPFATVLDDARHGIAVTSCPAVTAALYGVTSDLLKRVSNTEASFRVHQALRLQASVWYEPFAFIADAIKREHTHQSSPGR